MEDIEANNEILHDREDRSVPSLLNYKCTAVIDVTLHCIYELAQRCWSTIYDTVIVRCRRWRKATEVKR